MSRQLVFDLPVRPALGREDFFVSAANAHALAALDDWRNWPAGKLLLVGPEGSGKSHLGAVFAAESGAVLLERLDDLPPEGAHVVIDQLERLLPGDPVAQERLFHLHNHLAAKAGRLLLLSRKVPRDLEITLPDLLSRLEATPSLSLLPPDDVLFASVLVKHFADRQLHAPQSVVDYLLARAPRDLGAAARLVDVIDRLALQRGVGITRPLAAEAFLRVFPED